jgi:hypothetical protein
MAAVRISRKNPELSEQFRPIVITLLNHPIHSVVTAGIYLSCLMLKRAPSISTVWHSMLTPFRKLLKAFFESRGTQEYKFGGFHDPFLQVRVMQWLAAMNSPSDQLDDVLAAIVEIVGDRYCWKRFTLSARLPKNRRSEFWRIVKSDVYLRIRNRICYIRGSQFFHRFCIVSTFCSIGLLRNSMFYNDIEWKL